MSKAKNFLSTLNQVFMPVVYDAVLLTMTTNFNKRVKKI